MSETIAGITIPDSALAREATELVRDATSDVVFNHSRRVYLFGELRGRETGVTADPELLYVGAMFHDLGVTGATTNASSSTARTRPGGSC